MQVELERLQVMNLKENDIVVYRLDHVMTRRHMEPLTQYLRKVFTNNKVLVVDSNSYIQIIEDTPPPKPTEPPLVDYKEGVGRVDQDTIHASDVRYGSPETLKSRYKR